MRKHIWSESYEKDPISVYGCIKYNFILSAMVKFIPQTKRLSSMSKYNSCMTSTPKHNVYNLSITSYDTTDTDYMTKFK